MTENKYRLIWFQHFHKAAGSSIVQLAILNGEELYPQHKNGNPLNSDGHLIRLWDFTDKELGEFVDSCEYQGVTFVATEWGAPNFEILADDPRVVLITCLRNPLSRFVSDYYYEFHLGYTACKSLETYVNSNPNKSYTMYNYYCRVFSRHHERTEPITLDQFHQSIAALKLFNCLIILEKGDAFQRLNKFLGWKDQVVFTQKNSLNIRQIAKFIIQGNFNLVWRRFFNPTKKPTQNFIRLFEKESKLDFHLYDEAKSIYSEGLTTFS